jgi:uncharacterized membrane protein YagU involved in acid resistance
VSNDALPSNRPHVLVIGAGLLAATFDIVFACVFWAIKSAVPPERILQSVAAGILGETSFDGGALTAALGFVLHYLIMLLMALTYYLVARHFHTLRRWPVLSGSAYGLLLYAVMNTVVVPLSNAGPTANVPLWITLSIAVHVLLIGIPIALLAGRALAGPVPASA